MKSGLKSGSFIRKAEREARERERVRGREEKLGSDKMSQSYRVRKIFKLKVRGKISVIDKPKSKSLVQNSSPKSKIQSLEDWAWAWA